MPRSLGNVIADSLQLSLGYAERLLKNVPADRAGRFAVPGKDSMVNGTSATIFRLTDCP